MNLKVNQRERESLTFMDSSTLTKFAGDGSSRQAEQTRGTHTREKRAGGGDRTQGEPSSRFARHTRITSACVCRASTNLILYETHVHAHEGGQSISHKHCLRSYRARGCVGDVYDAAAAEAAVGTNSLPGAGGGGAGGSVPL